MRVKLKRAHELACLVAAVTLSGVCAAAQPFKPSSPDYVVLVLPRAQSQGLSSADLRARAARDPAFAGATARRYLTRARVDRDPSFFGRAEAIARPWIERGTTAPAELLIVQADIEQFRHDFPAALRLLDRAISREPHDAEALLMRASIHMVRGDPESARPDCRALLSAGQIALGSICLAQVIGVTDPERAAKLMRVWVVREGVLSDEQRAWALSILADLAVRSGDASAAVRALRAALRLSPQDETARAALADLLIAAGRPQDALRVLHIDRPGLGTLVQRARAEKLLGLEGPFRATRAAIADRVAIAGRRGERVHLREEAQVALYLDGDPQAALKLARENVAAQRESIDIRLLSEATQAVQNSSAPQRVDR